MPWLGHRRRPALWGHISWLCEGVKSVFGE
jgi:hypothetical protein